MSLGYGVGDVIAVSTLARTIWGRCRDASDQFDATRKEAANLCLVLDDITSSLSGLQVTDKQAEDLSKLVEGCRSVLDDTEKLIRKNESLGADPSGLGSKTQKAWKKLKWDSAIVNELRDRMVSSTTYLNTFSTSLTSQMSRATKDNVDRIAEDTQSLRLNQTQQEREVVLQWLSSLDFAQRQSDLSGRRQEGTGSWLLESQEFQDWVSKDGKTLVCQGIPGAGKTMLASLVVDHLQQMPVVENFVTAYVYCEYGRREEQTSINLIASVTKQLLQHQSSVPERILKIYEHHHSRRTRPNFEEILKMTGSLMSSFSRIYLIVDALDELGNGGQVRRHLIGRLRSLQDLHPFSLMTTSRYIPSLALEFHQPLCMDIRASPEDIERFVEGHMSDLPNCVRGKMDLQKVITSAIVDAVEGMFLLAQLHMDSLKDKTSPKLIKRALEALPKGSNALDLAYNGAMQRIEDQLEGFRLLAKQLLGWLTHSERLMSVQEVQHALAIEPGAPDFDEDNLGDIDEIVGFCAGLVIIDEETHIIRLVHYTTQEYFRRNGDKLLASAQLDIAISCLTYLLYENFGAGWVIDDVGTHERNYRSRGYPSVKARIKRYPFLEYAAMYWAFHTRGCEQRNVKELLMSFAKDDRKVSSASQVVLVLNKEDNFLRAFDESKSRNPLSAMQIIAYFGYEEMISKLLNYGFAADTEDPTHSTPLWWAARQGRKAVVSLLLSQNYVNVNHRSQFFFSTPLRIAAERGNAQVVKLLIQREDVDVNLPDRFGFSPLDSAVIEGYREVVELLLTREDIDVSTREPLTSAVNYDNDAIVKLLLAHNDIDVNAKTKNGLTSLQTAVERGYTSMVELLISHINIEVNMKDFDGRTALHGAAEQGHPAIVKLLLSRADIEVNSKNKYDSTPLHGAAKRGYEAIMTMLFGKGNIEVNSKDFKGNTPLTDSIISCRAAIVRLLCAHPDVDLDPRDNEGRDLLSLAKLKQERLSKPARIWLWPWMKDSEAAKATLQLEECLEILRTAIETRAQNGSQKLQPVPS